MSVWRLHLLTPLERRRHRSVLGPNELVTYEAELRPLDRIGLDELAMNCVRSLVLAHVAGGRAGGGRPRLGG